MMTINNKSKINIKRGICKHIIRLVVTLTLISSSLPSAHFSFPFFLCAVLFPFVSPFSLFLPVNLSILRIPSSIPFQSSSLCFLLFPLLSSPISPNLFSRLFSVSFTPSALPFPLSNFHYVLPNPRPPPPAPKGSPAEGWKPQRPRRSLPDALAVNRERVKLSLCP